MRVTRSRLPDSAVTKVLVARGVRFESRDVGIWTPPHLMVTATRIYWEDSPDPARWEIAHNVEEKIGHVRGMIDEVTAPDTIITFGYDDMVASILLRADDAMANLDALLEPPYTTWITARPRGWLIEAGRDKVVRLSLPPEKSAAERGRQLERNLLYVGGFVETLDAAGVRCRIIDADDPHRPDHPPHQNPYARKLATVAVRGFVDFGDRNALKAQLLPWLEARAQGKSVIVWQGNLDAPYVLMPGSALAANLGSFADLADIELDDHPTGLLRSTSVLAWSPGERWVLNLRREGPRWKFEALD